MINIDIKLLNRWINEENISYSEISKRLQCSITYVKKYAKKNGIILPIRIKKNIIPWNKGLKKIYRCKNCGKELIYNGYSYRQYCNNKCQKEYELKLKYEYYLNHQNEFIGKEINYYWLKKILLFEQHNKCLICGIENKWNNKDLHFILDHINGDATNNKRDNLRLICPNCDSQLDTYKSRNKGKSTRKYKPYRLF